MPTGVLIYIDNDRKFDLDPLVKFPPSFNTVFANKRKLLYVKNPIFEIPLKNEEKHVQSNKNYKKTFSNFREYIVVVSIISFGHYFSNF